MPRWPKDRKNPKLDRFITLCSMGQTSKEAGLAVGYSESTAERYRTAYKDKIKEQAATRFDASTPEAINTIIGLLKTGTGSVKLAAANRLLEGANLGVVHRSEVTHKTEEELDAQLLAACGGDPEKVKQLLAALRDDGEVKPPMLN